MARTFTKHSLTRKVFDELISSIDDFFTFGYRPIQVLRAGGLEPYRGMIRAKEKRWKREKERAAQQAIKRLAQQQYIHVRKQGDTLCFELTKKGIEEALRERILHTTRLLPEQQFCYVSFDIPEVARHARNILRHFLKQSEFTIIHHSLWFSKRDVAADIALLMKQLDLARWVHVFIGSSLTATQTQGVKTEKVKLRKKK